MSGKQKNNTRTPNRKQIQWKLKLLLEKRNKTELDYIMIAAYWHNVNKGNYADRTSKL